MTMKKTLTALLVATVSTTLATNAQNLSHDTRSQATDFPCCFAQPHRDNMTDTDLLLSGLKDGKTKKDAEKTGKATVAAPPSAVPKTPIYNDSCAMIKVSKDNDGYYFEIPDSIIGREILAVSRYTSIPAGLGTYAGEQFNHTTVYFQKNDIANTILLRTKRNYMKADTLDAIYDAVKASSSDPIVASFKIISDTKGVCKINVTSFLLSDNILSLPARQKTEFNIMGLNNDLSYIESIHSYPINTELRTVRTYVLNPRGGAPTMTFGLNTSFYLLPKVPMQARIFDPRVGYFTDGYYKFSDTQQQVDEEEIVCRRRLEPKNEADAQRQRNGELIEPKQQIVYYIDPATPKQWRPYLIQGVKDWNSAFEQAGWKNAITALEWPENDSTMSMEDSRYSVIMYLASDIANAYGPQNHDPRSGEIIECHVGWYHNVMSLVHDWYQVQCGAVDPEARSAKFSEKLMGELIRFVSSHEVGHTLGLRHNFGASATVPTDSLRSNDYLAKNGFCPSIMDYARFDYVAQPEDGVEAKNLFPRINQYDKWAIEWGYKPIYDATDSESDRFALSKITTERTNDDKRLFWYDGEGRNDDPRAQTEDLGDDAPKSGSLGIENLKRIITHLKDWNHWGSDNDDSRTDNMYNQVVGQYTRYCRHVINYLKGVYHTPLAPDQEGQVYQYPAKEKVEAAVDFLNKQLFTKPSWLVEVPYADRIFYDKDEKLEQITKRLIDTATQGYLISKINPTYGTDRYLKELTKTLFGNFSTSASVDRYQRMAQSTFIHNLCQAYKDNRYYTSNDAQACIYKTLDTIAKRLRTVASSDNIVSAHYTQLALEIERALKVKD